MKRTIPILFLAGILFLPGIILAGTPVIDGFLDAAAGYVLRTDPTYTPATRVGFGPAIDACQIWSTDDAGNVYFFITGAVNTASNDGILFLLDTTAETGVLPGTSLGGAPGGHCLGDPTNPNWSMDFEVDHAWVGNPGSTATTFFVDAKNYVGTVTAGYSGSTDLIGTPMADGFVPGVVHAFDNAAAFGSPWTGWEIQIPRGSLSGASSADSATAFAIVVSSTAFFSDDSAQDISGVWGPGGGGFNVTFSSVSGPQSTLPISLPVRVSHFAIE